MVKPISCITAISSMIGPLTSMTMPAIKMMTSRAMRRTNGIRTQMRLKRPRPRVAMTACQIFPALRACSAFVTR